MINTIWSTCAVDALTGALGDLCFWRLESSGLSIGKLTSVDNFETQNRLNGSILRNKDGNIWKTASMMDSMP